MNEIKHLSVDERAALGKAARERTRPSGHSGWAPADGSAGSGGVARGAERDA